MLKSRSHIRQPIHLPLVGLNGFPEYSFGVSLVPDDLVVVKKHNRGPVWKMLAGLSAMFQQNIAAGVDADDQAYVTKQQLEQHPDLFGLTYTPDNKILWRELECMNDVVQHATNNKCHLRISASGIRLVAAPAPRAPSKPKPPRLHIKRRPPIRLD